MQVVLQQHPHPPAYAIQAYLLHKGANKDFSMLHKILSNMNWGLKTGLIKASLDIGWDRTATDKEGRKPLDVARLRNLNDIVKILETYHPGRVEQDPDNPTA